MPRSQSEIPGTERPNIAEIETKAIAYEAAKKKRASALTKEIALKSELRDLMLAHRDELALVEKDDERLRIYTVDELGKDVILREKDPDIVVRKHSEESE